MGVKKITEEINETEFVKEEVTNQSELTQAFASGVTPLFTSDDEALILFADESQEEIINVVYGEEIIAKIYLFFDDNYAYCIKIDINNVVEPSIERYTDLYYKFEQIKDLSE